MNTETNSTAQPPSEIVPTVGRVLWFRNGSQIGATDIDQLQGNAQHQPMKAMVLYVHNSRCVNVEVVDHGGGRHIYTSCTLRQDMDPAPSGPYAEWMPYQVGQARKTS